MPGSVASRKAILNFSSAVNGLYASEAEVASARRFGISRRIRPLVPPEQVKHISSFTDLSAVVGLSDVSWGEPGNGAARSVTTRARVKMNLGQSVGMLKPSIRNLALEPVLGNAHPKLHL